MTIFEAYNSTKKELAKIGIEDSVFEAKLIIKHITGFDNTAIMMNFSQKLTEFQENNLTAILKQRNIRYPLQYILGEWDFYGRSYKVGPGVLVPRPDTETVIEVCKEKLKTIENPKILDLCAGSGCIAITLALETENSSVTAVEKYDEAISYLSHNIKLNKALNVSAVKGDIFEGIANDTKYDLIVSNPPYIASDEMELMSNETAFEPDTALYGGEDGMLFYRAILDNYKNSLTKGGYLVFEIGFAQGEAVSKAMEQAGFSEVEIIKDLGENDRVVLGKLI